jgi:integrase
MKYGTISKSMGGQQWWNEIINRLEWCDTFIYLLSNDSLNSEHCIKEYEIADALGKAIIPVKLRIRTEIPDNLKNLEQLQFVDFTEYSINSVTDLLNAVAITQRGPGKKPHKSIENLPYKKSTLPFVDNPTKQSSQHETLATYNYVAGLSQRLSRNEHTQRAYCRWLESYLTATANLAPSVSGNRIRQMSTLPLNILIDSMSAAQVRAWLNDLISSDYGTSDISQAKASVSALATLLREDGLIPDYVYQSIKSLSVNLPKREAAVKRRLLSSAQMSTLIVAAIEIATSESQRCRNHLAVLLLCTMLFRRSDITQVRWRQFSYTDSQASLCFSRSGEDHPIEVFPSVQQVLEEWQHILEKVNRNNIQDTYVIRRFWKNGTIGVEGISPEGVRLIVSEAAAYAGMGAISPEDLRFSGAVMLYSQYSYPIHKISILLGDKSIVSTSRQIERGKAYLSDQPISTFDLLNRALC